MGNKKKTLQTNVKTATKQHRMNQLESMDGAA